MSEQAKPKLWSDFDGTAVEIVSKTNPRNWSKYPLAGIAGYADFLRGVQSEGIEIAGIVSRRRDFWRRYVTALSVAKLGLDEFFQPQQLILAGSESNKALFIATQSKEGVVGIIDDKPHKLGPLLMSALAISASKDSPTHVVLGAVDHSRTDEFTGVFIENVQNLGMQLDISEVTESHFRFAGANHALDFVYLQPYSDIAGQNFGRILKSV